MTDKESEEPAFLLFPCLYLSSSTLVIEDPESSGFFPLTPPSPTMRRGGIGNDQFGEVELAKRTPTGRSVSQELREKTGRINEQG